MNGMVSDHHGVHHNKVSQSIIIMCLLSFSYFEYSIHSGDDFNIIPIPQVEMQTFFGLPIFLNKIYYCYISCYISCVNVQCTIIGTRMISV